jgi:DNA-binding response OmpR family regulator
MSLRSPGLCAPACDVARPAILLVEQDPLRGAALAEQLAADGYAVRLARSREHARTLARSQPPELLILGELDGAHGALELLSEIRAGARSRDGRPDSRPVHSAWGADLPVVVLGVRSHEADLLRAFEAGADDFLARPASYLELRARLRAILARSAPRHGMTLVRAGALAIDTSARAVSLHGRRVSLRRLEYELLLTLARDPERVFTRQELVRLVWGQRIPGSTRTLDTHASRLRRTLDASGSEGWILNVRGVGYRLS